MPDLKNYLLSILIEENPFVLCKRREERFITYEHISYVIIDMIYDTIKETNTNFEYQIIEDTIRKNLEFEFGPENLSKVKVNRVISRFAPTLLLDETKGF